MMFVRNVAPVLCRRRASLWGAFIAIAGFAAPLSAQRSVDLHVFRFWRPPDLTLTDAFTTTPLSLLSFVRAAEGEQIEAIVDRRIQVLDQSGLAIFNQVARDTIRVPAMSGASIARSEVSHHYEFQLKPGSYRVRYELTDVRTNEKWTAEKQTSAFAQMPRSSDLVVASDLSTVEAGAPAPVNAIVRGKLAVTPNFTGALSPDHSRLALYTEVYRPNMPPDSAQVQIIVTGQGHSFNYRTPPQQRIYPSGIGSEAFALDLTGLPPGNYDLQMRIGADRDTIALSHRLSMLPPGAGIVRAETALLYPTQNEAQLDSLFAPMRYIASLGEVEAYNGLSGADAKRHWLSNFWQQRAAASGESVEELLRDWEERLAFANRDFQPTRRGQAGRAGWQTDRGRIYLKHGPPAEREVANQTRVQEIKACEVWQYSTGRGERYVFFDRTGFGDFDLVWSTDRNEPGIPGFESRFQTGRFSCTNV